MNPITLKHPLQQFRAYLPLVFITLGYFIAMNLFEAGQQLYYIKQFSLAQEEVTYFELLKNHFFRWLVWFVITLPFVHFTLNNRITQRKRAIYSFSGKSRFSVPGPWGIM